MAPQRSAAQSLRVAANQDMPRVSLRVAVNQDTLRKAFASRLTISTFSRTSRKSVLVFSGSEFHPSSLKRGYP